MFGFALAICGFAVLICLWRVALGPTAFDRILGVNAVGSLVIVGISLHGFLLKRPDTKNYIFCTFSVTIVALQSTIQNIQISPKFGQLAEAVSST